MNAALGRRMRTRRAGTEQGATLFVYGRSLLCEDDGPDRDRLSRCRRRRRRRVYYNEFYTQMEMFFLPLLLILKVIYLQENPERPTRITIRQGFLPL